MQFHIKFATDSYNIDRIIIVAMIIVVIIWKI